MNRFLSTTFSSLLLLLLTLSSCRKNPQAETAAPSAVRSSKKQVYVVNYPLKYFAERIAGDAVEVVLPEESGPDPAFWQPDAATIQAYQNADLVLLNGATYAKWVARATLRQSRLVNTSRDFEDQFIFIEDAVTHSHGPEGMHTHAGTAFTTWLDPQQAVMQAAIVQDALSRLVPDRADEFKKRFAGLRQDLESLDQSIANIVAAAPSRPLIASHPVYQYFQRRYQLNLKSVHWEPGEMPSDDMWRELEEMLKKHPAHWMIWEGEPRADVAAKLEERGVKSAVFDPCGAIPDEGDYLTVMRRNIENLKQVFE